MLHQANNTQSLLLENSEQFRQWFDLLLHPHVCEFAEELPLFSSPFYILKVLHIPERNLRDTSVV